MGTGLHASPYLGLLRLSTRALGFSRRIKHRRVAWGFVASVQDLCGLAAPA